MKNLLTLFLVLSGPLVLAQDLEEILNKHYLATGQDHLSGIRSLMKTGKIVQPDQSEITFTVYQKRKGKIRTEGNYQGNDFLQICDGQQAWFKASWSANGEVEELLGDELDQTKESAYIDGPLFALARRDYDIQLQGRVNEDDGSYFRLSVKKSPSRTTTFLLDVDTYLIYKTIDETFEGGKGSVSETIYRNYKEIGPIALPMRFQTTDEHGRSRIFIDEVVFGFAAKDELFEKPNNEPLMAYPTLKAAIVQHGPVYFNKEQSLEKAGDLLAETAKEQVDLAVFGETWLSGYPAWLDYCPNVALWDHEPVKDAFALMYDNAVSVNGQEVALLSKLARQHHTSLIIGVNEKVEQGNANGTLFNSLLIINKKGELVNHHRKLMPTFTEKMLYGLGDGHGLQAPTLEGAKIGGLICWEHWMPLTRQAMHDSGEQVHAALWPKVHEMLQIASRAYAFEGRCFVLAAGQIMRASEFPEGLDLPSDLANHPNQMVLNGGSCIIGPDGKFLVEPVFDQETVLLADLDISNCYKEKMTLDVTGHYQRNDVFNLGVDRSRPVD